jgi:hypothetical protein
MVGTFRIVEGVTRVMSTMSCSAVISRSEAKAMMIELNGSRVHISLIVLQQYDWYEFKALLSTFSGLLINC